MICRHDTHTNSSTIPRFSSHASPLPSPAFSLVSIRYNSFFPATPAPLLFQLAVNAKTANLKPRQLPNPTSFHAIIPTLSRSVYLSLSVVVLVSTGCSMTQRSTTSLCLSHHLSRHFSKSCAPTIPSVSFVFVTPKVSRSQELVYPYYHAGWSHSSDSLSWWSRVRRRRYV